MDVLSDVVTTMRAGQPHAGRVAEPARFGGRFPPFDGAGFHAVQQGSCWLIPADGDPIALRAGDIAFLPHGCAHGLADSPSTPLMDASASPDHRPARRPDRRAEPPTDRPDTDRSAAGTVLLCGAYLLDRSRSHPLLSDLPAVVHLPAQASRQPGLRAVADMLGSEFERPRPGASAMVAALLEALLLQILRAWLSEPAGHGAGTGWAAALHDPGVAAALQAIHEDPSRSWTVEGLAAQARLSRSAFSRRFNALVGQPPLAYLTWWRLTLAAGLLRDSDAPLSAVARQVGYRSEFAFAHAFKREYGLAPGGFRRTRRVA